MTMLKNKFLTAAAMAAALLSAPLLTAQQAGSERVVAADLHSVKGARNMAWRYCIGSDHGGLLLREINRKQLELAHKELGFEYIRFHGIFHDDTNPYEEKADGSPVYHWETIDKIYDTIRATGMRPFVELGFMPKPLARGKQTIFYWQGNTTPPKDYKKWGDFIEAFVRHLEQRYGKDEIRRWRFEVWNEPNLRGFFDGDQKDYFELYDTTVAAIKRVDKDYVVGGPATAGAGWIEETLAHVKDNKLPLDFISTHTYGVDGGFLDEKGNSDQKLSQSYDAVIYDMRTVHEKVDKSPWPKLPIHFTEWNSSYSPGDPVHDTYLNAAFVLDKIKHTEGYVDSLSYWTYTDLFEEAGVPHAEYQGNFGLLTRSGLRKATYYAYMGLNQLQPVELKTNDERAWVTKNEDGSKLSALFWDYSLPKQDKTDGAYFREIHPAADKPAATLKIASVKPGKYALKLRRTGFKSNDAYTRWLEMGKPDNPSPEQMAELTKLAAEPFEREEVVTVGADGLLSTTVKMRENDTVYLSLERVQ